MAERQRFPHRAYLPDARGDDQHLRVTWHPSSGQFVFSTWRDNTCTAATRVDAGDVPELITLLANGLADSADPGHPPTQRAAGP